MERAMILQLKNLYLNKNILCFNHYKNAMNFAEAKVN